MYAHVAKIENLVLKLSLEPSENCPSNNCNCQTDTNILNLVISPKQGVARFTSTIWQSYNLQEIQLTQKETLVEKKNYRGSMPLLTPNHSYKTFDRPYAFNFLRNVE